MLPELGRFPSVLESWRKSKKVLQRPCSIKNRIFGASSHRVELRVATPLPPPPNPLLCRMEVTKSEL